MINFISYCALIVLIFLICIVTIKKSFPNHTIGKKCKNIIDYFLLTKTEKIIIKLENRKIHQENYFDIKVLLLKKHHHEALEIFNKEIYHILVELKSYRLNDRETNKILKHFYTKYYEDKEFSKFIEPFSYVRHKTWFETCEN